MRKRIRVGDKVLVCGKLETIIENIEFDGILEVTKYWFKDELGSMFWEEIHRIEKI